MPKTIIEIKSYNKQNKHVGGIDFGQMFWSTGPTSHIATGNTIWIYLTNKTFYNLSMSYTLMLESESIIWRDFEPINKIKIEIE
jgi:hypothetical protein